MDVWLTTEGFEIQILHRREKKETSLSDLQTALHSEINSKLNYGSYVSTASSTFNTLCKNQQNMLRILNTLVEIDPDLYVKALLRNTYITSSITDIHIVVWPCKPVDKWSYRKDTDEKGMCSTLVPVTYLLGGANQTGYLNLRTNHIESITDMVDCNNIVPQAVVLQKAGGWVLTLWDGRRLVELPKDEGVSLPLLMSNRTANSFVPTWENHWLYTEHDFTFTERHYLTERDLERVLSSTRFEDTASDQNDLYGGYMRVPFITLPTLPSLERCFELLGMTGGLLYLWKVIALVRKGRARHHIAQTQELKTLYDIYKETRNCL